MNRALAFDGTDATIAPASIHGDTRTGWFVTVTEGGVSLSLETVDGGDLYTNALANLRAVKGMDAWVADRIAFVFSLAARRLAAA